MTERTGWKQAVGALRSFGLRPARRAACPLIAPSQRFSTFLAVKLRSGLRDVTISGSDVCYWADTLTELVEMVQRGEAAHGPPTPIPPNDPPEPIPDGPPPAVSFMKLDTPAPKPPATPKGNGGIDSAIRILIAEAIKNGVAVDAEEVRVLVRETSADAIAAGVEEAVKALGVKQTVSVKLPDTPEFDCSSEHDMFPVLMRELALGLPIFLCGPSGSGKTTAAENAAKKLGRTYYVQPPVADRFELLGFIDAGGTYQASPAYRWANDPGSVLILDEIDRSHANALTAMHTLLANGLAVFPNGQKQIHDSNRIIATGNTWGLGPDAEYVGSGRLDAATVQRFITRIYWGYDTALELQIAQAKGGTVEEAQWCQRMRSVIEAKKLRVIWSPRDTAAHCLRVATGVDRQESLGIGALATVPEETRKQLGAVK